MNVEIVEMGVLIIVIVITNKIVDVVEPFQKTPHRIQALAQ